MTRRRPPSEPGQPGCGALPVECPASALCKARRCAGWSFRHNVVPSTSRCGAPTAAAINSRTVSQAARASPPSRFRWCRKYGRSIFGITNTHYPRDFVEERVKKTVQGCRARVPRPIQATRPCGQDDAPCLPQLGRASPACPQIDQRARMSPHLPAWSMPGAGPDLPHPRRITTSRAPPGAAMAAESPAASTYSLNPRVETAAAKRRHFHSLGREPQGFCSGDSSPGLTPRASKPHANRVAGA